MKISVQALSILLLIIVGVVFSPVLWNDFLYLWDDQWMVMNHYTENGITLGNLWAILTEYYNGQYSPVCEYLYLFLYTFFGYDPLPFHLASLLLHVGCVYLVIVIIRKLFAQTTRVKYEYADYTALLTALLFGVHTLNVESVAWISAAKILIFAFFHLCATYTFLLFLEKGKWSYYVYTLLLFTLSFGGKEQAVIFPVWLLLLLWLLGYRLNNWRRLFQVIPFFLLALLFGIIAMQSQPVGWASEMSYPLWQRFILGCYSLVESISKYLFPYHLLYIYPFPMAVREALPQWMLLYPVLLTTIIVFFWRQICQWPVICGLLFFLIQIALTLHIIPIPRFAVVADRYIYLGSIGLSFIVSYYVIYLLHKKNKVVRVTTACLLVVVVLFLSVYSNLRCREWKDSNSIKKELRELIQKRPYYDMEKFNYNNMEQ